MPTAYRIGHLRHRITLERPERASDGRGGWVETWSPAATVWAAVEAIRASERVVAQQTQGSVTYHVVIRYRSDVTADMRVVWNGRPLYLVGPPYDFDGRRRYLVLECEERKE